MNTLPTLKRTVSFWLTAATLLVSAHATALVATVNPSTALTPVTNTTSVNFTYSPAATSVTEQSTQAFLCTNVLAASQVGGAFPSGPTPLAPNSFCLTTQAAAPGIATINLAGAVPGGETFTMTPAAFIGLYDGVGGYATVYFVRSWFDNLGLQTYTVSRLQLVPTLRATPDTISVIGGNSADVIANDFIEVLNASATNVVLSIVNNGGITGLSVVGSQLLVPTTTNGGSYNVTYRICDAAPGGAANCANGAATLNVIGAPLPQADAATVVSSSTSNVNVLANDRIGSTVATIANATVTLIAPLPIAGLTVNPGGQIAVPPGAPGSYVVNYQLCNAFAPTVCANAALNLTVSAPVPVANPDSISLPSTGGSVAVLANDTVDGGAATVSNVVVSIVSTGGLSGVSVNAATGALTVPAFTAGSYAVNYRICSTVVAVNCATATATITLAAAGVAVVAGNDSAALRSTVGGNIVVMSNDTVGGSPASIANSTRTLLSSGGLPGIGFSLTTGQMEVPAFVAGQFPARYRLCALASPTSCADATVTITMVPDVVAATDSFALTTAGGVAPVLDNDKVDAAAATATNVTVTIVANGGLSGLSVNSAGALLVPAASAGRFEATYRICSTAVSSACATASATFTLTTAVSAAADSALLPNTGGDVDVLANDTVSNVVATARNVLLTITYSDRLNGLTVTDAAKIRVPPNNLPGTYAPTYRICSLEASPVCASSTARITIGVPIIVAQPETVGLPSTGGRVELLDNDTYNGAPASSSNVTVTLTNAGGLAGLSVDERGGLLVPASAPGTYSVAYRVCALAQNASICAAAVATIAVAPPVILLVADRLAIADSGGVLAVLANDLIAGVPATAANAAVTIVSNGGLTTLAVNANGELVLAATQAGTYTVTYRVCARAAPATCAVGTAVVTVNISALVIKLADDVVVSGQLGATFNVLTNDTVATRAVVDSAVILTLLSNGGLPTLTLAATGVLTIPPSSAGVYVAAYRVCQKNFATNCAEARVRITITQGQGVGETARHRPPSVPGAATATYTLAPGSNAPIIFSQPVPSSAGAANSPLILGETRLGYGATAAAGRFQSYRNDSAFEPFGAQFQYSGTGTLNYRWEVVRPGEPEPDVIDLYPEQSLSLADRLRQTRYSEISRGQLFLPAMGRYFLRGPDPALLPRASEGNYLILLRIEASTASVNGALNGATAFLIQPLTYVMVGDRGISTTPVDSRDPDARAAAARRRLSGGSSVAEFSNMGQLPDAGPRLNDGSLRLRPVGEQWKSLQPTVIEIIGAMTQADKPITLSWKAVPEVVAYRVVLESAGLAAASVVVAVKPSAEARLVLTASALASISAATSNPSIRWQVLAYASDGKIIAISDWSLLKR